MRLPDLELSYGQLLWAIHYGREPDQMLRDRVRYLRQMDIPAAAAREAEGSGKRISYDFFDLIELGLAVTPSTSGSGRRRSLPAWWAIGLRCVSTTPKSGMKFRMKLCMPSG